MSEFAKSILRFSWALSLLGSQKTFAVLAQADPQQPQLSEIADTVTQAAVSQLDSSLQGIFRTADAVQQSLFNAASAVFDSSNWGLLKMLLGAWQTPCKGDRASEGWAPVSPPPELDAQGQPVGGQ